MRELTVSWEKGTVTARIEGRGPAGVLLAHGAGTSQDHPAMTALRGGLARGGHTVMSFNYPYTERGSRRPDRQDTLLAVHRAAADALAPTVERLVLAGRSMGGRIGTYLAADGYPVHALVLYAYPLHPAGKHDRLRVDQFPQIHAPMLFLQGTKDPLSRMDLFERHIGSLPNAEVVLLDGAGHGPGAGGWSAEKMTDRYVSATLGWLERLSSGGSGGQRS